MKKLALFVMLMSLGMFSLGCGEGEKPETTDKPVVEEGAETDAPGEGEEELDAPKDEAGAPAEKKEEEKKAE